MTVDLPVGKTFVVDTSILLSDPHAVTKFGDDNLVLLPAVVLSELEAKRDHPDLGFYAREALRLLEELRVTHGRLDAPVQLPDGGCLKIELNHTDPSVLPTGFRLDDNDSRILAVALALSNEGHRVVLVSKDLPMRVKAAVVGLDAEEFKAEWVMSSGWTGFTEIDVAPEIVNEAYSAGRVHLPDHDLPVNTGVVLLAGGNSSALTRVCADKSLRLIRGDQDMFGVHGRSAPQRIALDLLNDPDIGIVSLGGAAGTGKSALALAAGLEWVVERNQFQKIIVFRPVVELSGQHLGFLPGDAHDKMAPWGQAVFDCLDAIAAPDVVRYIKDNQLIEVLPLTHIRGRSLNNAYVVIDEAQQLERGVLVTALTRIGDNARVVLTHDWGQRDLRVGRHDGVMALIESLKGHPLFAHITLTRSERSPIAGLINDLIAPRW